VSNKLRTLYVGVCWIPAVLWVLTRTIVRSSRDWGGYAWGMVLYPVSVVALTLSLVLAIVGLAAIIKQAVRRRFDPAFIVAVVVAASVIWYASVTR
jgi:hypothetical protein